MGKGSSSQTSTTSGPPQAFLDAYKNVFNQAQGVAGQPLQQYPIGPGASNVVQPLTQFQNRGINTIQETQGQQVPYLHAADEYIRRAGQAITPLQFQGVENLPGQGLAGFANASDTAAGLSGTVAPYLATSRAGDPSNFAGNVGNYFNPYQQNVVDTTRQLFNEQNAEALNQVRGNAATQNAFGGDREAIAEAVTARQQALAQNPVIAQLEAQGYTQAAQELAQQQQLGLAGGQLAEGTSLAGGQLGLSAGQGLLGEFNTQQQTGVGAQEATNWLNQAAGYGMANLGQENQNLQLQGAQAMLGAGGLQQAYLQQVLNAPYEQFIQQQAYPFQTTGWLANIAEGLGGASGGTSTTKYPGPSTLGQIGGAGLAGVGLAGQLGAFNGFGGGGSSNPGSWDWTGGTGGAWDWSTYNDGGRITAANGGRMEPEEYAGGGLASSPPDLSASIVPGASGMGAAPASGGGGGLAKMFMQPVTTQTTKSGGGGGILGAVGSIVGSIFGGPVGGAIGSLAGRGLDSVTGFDEGGSVPRETYDGGGSVTNTGTNGTPMRLITLAVPDLSKSYIPTTQAPARTMGQPAAPAAPQQGQGVGNPLNDALSTFKSAEGLSKTFRGDNDTRTSLGGAVEPSPIPLQYDFGGMVAPQVSSPQATGSMGTASPMQQYGSMSAEKLQELAMRYPPTTPQGVAIARALQRVRQNPTGGYPGGPTPAGPYGASGEAQAGTTAARGGRMGLADGGFGQDVLDMEHELAGLDYFQPGFAENAIPPRYNPAKDAAFDAERMAQIESQAGMGRDERMIQMMRDRMERPRNYSIGLADGGDIDPSEYIEPPPRGWRPPAPIDKSKMPTHYDAGGDVDEWGMEDYVPRRVIAHADLPLQGWSAPVAGADLPSDRIVAHADLRPRPRGNDVSRVREQDYGGLSLSPLPRDRGAYADLPPPPPTPRDRGASSAIPPMDWAKEGLAGGDFDMPRREPVTDPLTGAEIRPSYAPVQTEMGLAAPAAAAGRTIRDIYAPGPAQPPGPAMSRETPFTPATRAPNDVAGVSEQPYGGLSLPPEGLGASPIAAIPDVPSYENALGQPLAGPTQAPQRTDRTGWSSPPDDYGSAEANRIIRGAEAGHPTGRVGAQDNLVTPRQAEGRGRLGWHQIADLARKAGFPEDKVPVITAIALGESGGNPNAYNGRGENSYGLTQINADAHGPVAREALNPERALQLAFQVSKGGRDFTPWSVYKDGSYRSYLQPGSVGAGGGPGRGVAGLTEHAMRPDRMAGPSEQLTPAAAAAPEAPRAGLAERPDRFDHRRDRESGLAGFMNSPWMPLIAAGAGMLASRSPYPGVALGEGMLTGIKAAGQSTDRETRAQLAEVRSQRVEDQAKHMGDLVTQAKDKLSLQQTLGEGKQQVSEANLVLKQQLADAATLRATTALAAAQSQAEARDIQNKLKEQLAAIQKGTWQQGEGPDATDPAKRVPGMWHLPSSGAEPVFHPGVTAQKPATGEKAILDDLVKSGAAKDTAEAIRLHAEMKRDPHAAQNSQGFARLVEVEAARLQNSLSGMQLSQGQIEAQARRNVNARLQGAPSSTTAPAAAAPAVSQPTPGTAGAPTWARGSAVGPNGATIYTDGKSWFNTDHTPYQ